MSTKRRVAAAASSEATRHGQKRRKISDDSSTEIETPQTTTEVGLKLLSHIKQSTDKNGRQIATSFLHLPDRDKLNRYQYPNVTALESDLKRMVSNAKFYNEKSSLIFADAERIRKILSNNMPKINPAYKDPKYVAFPTPIPDEVSNDNANEDVENQELEDAGQAEASSTSRRQTPRSGNGRPLSSTPLVDDHTQSEAGFEGDSLQSAQDKIISEMIRLKDADGREVGLPFINKPDRNLYKDYYEIIQHPVSLRGIQKQVRGTDGKKNALRTTAFPTWQSFEEEVEYIWRNAREFNEDGSEIFVFAGVLEDYFKRRVAEARKLVPDSTQTNGDGGAPRLKLRMGAVKTPEPSSQRLTLKLPGQKPDTVPKEERMQPGVTVDGEALRRQQELVRAGSNGQDIHARATPPTTRNLRKPPGSPRSSSGKGQMPQEHQRSSSATSLARSSTAAVKSEAQAAPSPGLAAVISREGSQESVKQTGGSPAAASPVLPAAGSEMPPPSSATPRPSSGSPWPPSHPVSHPPHAYPSQNVSPLDSVLRQPGKDASHTLIENVSIFTHPSLTLRQGFHLDIPSSPTASQQCVTINLPSSHNFISIRPSVAASTPQRQTKLVVSLGMQKVQVPSQDRSSDQTKPTYDIRLNTGVTKVDLEMIAGPSRGVPKSGPPGSDLEYERVTIYFNLLRQ
ncbi:hypothetical protein VTN00DRAFT_2859 [Thermoascus crustaceus]|uniref:uncharacterized protein n=1 Tax=Thermoascus crustaceus TaxID=5088 RepID=UPI003742B7FA